MKYGNIDFNGKTILITGGGGFIGSNLAFYFQNNYPKSRVILFDIFRSLKKFENGNLQSFGHFDNLQGFSGEIFCGNINSDSDLSKLEEYHFDYIFHQAAISDTRVYDQEMVFRTNLNSFYAIIQIAKRCNAKLIYASSAATYGSLPSPQVIGVERPENPYAYSKFSMDRIALSDKYSAQKIIGLRYFNVYGDREFYKNKTSSMVIQLAHQILKGERPKLFENSRDIYRDFIYIEDIIQSNILACEYDQNGVFNVGTGLARSFQDIADILQKELGTKYETQYFPNPYSDYQSFTQADISLTKKYLNFEPRYSLEKGVKSYIPYIIKMFDRNLDDQN